MRREYEPGDAADIAYHYNLNFDRDEPLWCPDGSRTNSSKIKRHAMSLSVRGKRLTQVHTEHDEFVSYFGGFIKNNNATFKIAVVNLEHPDPKELFRVDAAYALAKALKQGVEHVLLSGSSDGAYFASWAVEEVGMKRQGDSPLWCADKGTVQRYIRNTL